MKDAEIVITYRSERYLWYVQRGDATAVISADDMMNEFHRWTRAGSPGAWGHNATAFCRRQLEEASLSDPERE